MGNIPFFKEKVNRHRFLKQTEITHSNRWEDEGGLP